MNGTFQIKFVGYLLVIPFLFFLFYAISLIAYSVDTYIDWTQGKVSTQLFSCIIILISIILFWVILYQRHVLLDERDEHIRILRNKEYEFKRSVEPMRKEFKMELLTAEEEYRKKVAEIRDECQRKMTSNRIDYMMKRSEREKQFQDLLAKEKNMSNERINEQRNLFQLKINRLESDLKRIECVLESKTPFHKISSIFAELETAVYDDIEHYLRIKPRPAVVSADIIKEIKEKYRLSVENYREMKYKYDFILTLFPEIKAYIDDDESLIQIERYSSLSDLNDNTDSVRYWLENDEYDRLSEVDRNQLALDRYRSRNKSNWEIGIEYELYIGYLLREGLAPFNNNYKVIQYGELNGVNDLGRDIIAETYEVKDKKTVYIIQCKRWSEDKLIHENAICQLFGTTMEYKIQKGEDNECKYVPMFITTTELSNMAKKFAEMLNVRVIKVPMGDFPMIKCNINGNQKIYHLPFDQQYHKTMIKDDGEFYAKTVKEAVEKGFRRAMRHFNTN